MHKFPIGEALGLVSCYLDFKKENESGCEEIGIVRWIVCDVFSYSSSRIP